MPNVLTVDTNVVVYSVDSRNRAKQAIALAILETLRLRASPVCLQVVGEFFSVVSGKLRLPAPMVVDLAQQLLTFYPIFVPSRQTMARALSEAAAGRFSFWDANLLSAAEAAGCTHLLTEDMADGQRLGRLEIVHPFDGDALSPRARSLLEL